MRRLRDSALRFAPSSDDLCTWNEAIGVPIFKSLQESLCLLSCTVLDAGTNKALDHSASQYCLAGVASQIQRGPPAQVLAPKSCLATKRPSVATKACVPIKEKRKNNVQVAERTCVLASSRWQHSGDMESQPSFTYAASAQKQRTLIVQN